MLLGKYGNLKARNMKSLFPKQSNLKVLCLGAHSDDIEIGCGGTLLKMFQELDIAEVFWVVFSSNDIRKVEAENSASAFLQSIPQKTIRVESFRDGFLPYVATEVKESFESIKKEINPDIIFTHYRNDRHQDHRLVSDLTWNTFRNHLILEYEIPKWDGDLGITNSYVEIPEELINLKIKILRESFASQTGKHWFDEETFKAILRLRGMESACKYAEAFYSRKLKLI